MNKCGFGKYFLFTILVLIFWCCQDNPTPKKDKPKIVESIAPYNTLSDKEVAIGWELLFDGKSTDLWRGYNQNDSLDNFWKIDSLGFLIGQKDAKDIITKSKFEDFELTLEFQLSEKGNSALFYRVIEVEAHPIWFNAPQYTIVDNSIFSNKDTNHPNYKKHICGSVFDVMAPQIEIENPNLDWQKARLVVHSGHVEHWLNDERILEFKIGSEKWNENVSKSKFRNYLNFGKANIGHIGLKGNDANVKFRNIKVREL